jgi:hypothetical protein
MLLIVILSSLLTVEPTAEEASDAAARASFTNGASLYKQGQFKQALEEFEKTFRLKPHPTVTFNIGRCHEKLGDVPRALGAYRMYLRAAPESQDAKIVTETVARFENALKAKGIVQFFVVAEPPQSNIEVDGKILGHSPATIELGAGKHTLVIAAAGYETMTRSFVTVLGRSTEMELSLKKLETRDAPVTNETPKQVESQLIPATNVSSTNAEIQLIPPTVKVQSPRVFTWVATGLAVVAGGTGAVVGVMNSNTEALIKSAQLRTATASTPNAQELQKRMGQEGTIANASFVTAGVAGIAAVILFFVEGN